MREITKENLTVTRQEISRNKAIELFKNLGENYKVEIIEQIDKADNISAYSQGDFIDLCRGPHVPSTGKIKYFKLLSSSGAYWRGDEKNKMLQRIYGTVFSSKDALKNYLIFLDQNLPFHSAQFFRNEKPPVTEAKYYPALHNTFLKLEKKFKMEVVIAPHPRADISKYKYFFTGRKVSSLDTIELVKKSNGVLTHTSTAVSFAVIYRKPIIFLTSNEIIQSYDDYRVHNSSRIFNSKLINIDNKKCLNNINSHDFVLSTDRLKYDLYFKNYIKHPDSENISMVNLIENNLR